MDLPSSPYKGLVPYSEDDAAFFFGRDKERDLIIANLIASRLTVLYGASGVGKSSVLRAGVSHTLQQEANEALASGGRPEFLILSFASWRDDPVAGLKSLLRSALAGFVQEGHPAPSDGRLDEILDAWSRATGCDLLVILDQFEEFFLYHSSEDGEGTFAFELARAVNRPGLRANFLISLREDSLAKLDAFKGRIPTLFNNYLRISHLGRDEARSAIVEPIEEYNRRLGPGEMPVTIEPDLTDAILDQVKSRSVLLSEGAGGGSVSNDEGKEEIETPYLQLVLTRLWTEEMLTGSRRLRLETLTRLGGAEEIVSTHLDRVMDMLPQEEQATAAAIFRFLVTRSGTKIAHSAGDLADYAEMSEEQVKRALDQLAGDARIVRAVQPPLEQAGGVRYEIFHDVLATPILDWRSRFSAKLAAAQEIERERNERAKRVRRLRFGAALASVIMVPLAIVLVLQFLANARRANEFTTYAKDSRASFSTDCMDKKSSDCRLLWAITGVERKGDALEIAYTVVHSGEDQCPVRMPNDPDINAKLTSEGRPGSYVEGGQGQYYPFQGSQGLTASGGYLRCRQSSGGVWRFAFPENETDVKLRYEGLPPLRIDLKDKPIKVEPLSRDLAAYGIPVRKNTFCTSSERRSEGCVMEGGIGPFGVKENSFIVFFEFRWSGTSATKGCTLDDWIADDRAVKEKGYSIRLETPDRRPLELKAVGGVAGRNGPLNCEADYAGWWEFPSIPDVSEVTLHYPDFDKPIPLPIRAKAVPRE